VTALSSVTTLEKDGTTFHVVGTAHVSRRSVEEVTRVIEELRPEVVCVELCQGRYDALSRRGEGRWRHHPKRGERCSTAMIGVPG
jgi:pheromone shutdown protein TraB